MRFATRTFLWSFVPLAVVLGVSFGAMRNAAISAAREGLRESLQKDQALLAGEHMRSSRENGRLLRVAADNAALKAGLQLLRSEPFAREAARQTVEDQLSEMANTLGFDFLVISGPDGQPLAGIVREEDGFSSADLMRFEALGEGFFSMALRVYRVTEVALDQGGELGGTLAAGQAFDLSALPIPAVLMHNGSIVSTAIPSLPITEASEALAKCNPEKECEFKIAGDVFLSLPLEAHSPRGENSTGFHLRSLQNVNAASVPVQTALRGVFVRAGGLGLIGLLVVSFVSSRSIVRPLGALVARLRESERTGTLPEFLRSPGSVQEIRELMEGFNHAASAIHQAQDQLLLAYVEFVRSLAQALDARDPYTAGHSHRVSLYACAIAKAMRVPEEDLEVIRVGALLHDVGKIGIPDAVLRKPGRLNDEEEALIRQHPVIGKTILKGIHGFEPYLDIVELHHEDWNGGGYPRGLKGEQTPLLARIVKVADAYDAMTSDRPYRRGMDEDKALGVLHAHVGSQFDSTIVAAFAGLHMGVLRTEDSAAFGTTGLQTLAPVMSGEESLAHQAEVVR